MDIRQQEPYQSYVSRHPIYRGPGVSFLMPLGAPIDLSKHPFTGVDLHTADAVATAVHDAELERGPEDHDWAEWCRAIALFDTLRDIAMGRPV